MFGRGAPKPNVQMDKGLANRPAFHKHNTVDNLFAAFYGFQSGSLLVQIISARNLSKSDPSCFCDLQLEKQRERTSVISKGNHPRWNEEFCFEMKESKSELFVHVVHASKMKIGKGKILGSVKISMRQLIDGQIHEGWFPLAKEIDSNSEATVPSPNASSPHGEIFLKLQYTSEIDRNRDYIIAKENKATLMMCLLHHDLVLISTLCKVWETEELSKTIIRIFNSEGQSLRLLIQLIYRDLKATNSEDVLFRTDSMSTKTTRNYFKMIAPDYLRNTLSKPVQTILSDPSGYEIDPSKLKSNENLQDNQRKLMATTQLFLDTIMNSVDSMPVNMRKFFNLLRQLVKPCFPQKELKSIGALFFLRFLVPAITTPNSFPLVNEGMAHPEVRRALTLIGKMIQNLANEIKEFKEEYMTPMNVFLEENVPKMKSFYELASTIPAAGPDDAFRPKFTDEDRIKCLSLIVGALIKNLSTVEKKLVEDPRMKDEETIKQNLEQFVQLKKILEMPIDSMDVRPRNNNNNNPVK